MNKDPIINLTINSIRKPINLLYDNTCFLAGLTIIFSSIDTLSNLNRPKEVLYGTKNDFINWMDEYFHLAGDTIIKPIEWYAVRCSILHSYTAQSSLHDKPNIRKIGWFVKRIGENVLYKEHVSNELIMVEMYAFRDAFYAAMDGFLMDTFKEKSDKSELIEKRLTNIYHTYDDEGIAKIGEEVNKEKSNGN